jgi:hypothetical protein
MSVYNGERFLTQAVESILQQSFREFELIAIDDGSSDASSVILDSYQRNDPRFRVYHQRNRGLVVSLNRGCDLARGKYIARMDADDIAIKNRLECQVEFMERNPEVGVLGSAVQFIDPDGAPSLVSRNPIADREIRQALVRHCPFWHPTVCIRKDILTLVGGYRSVVVDAEDYDLWLRIADRCQLANLEGVLLQYRLHPYQVTVRKHRQTALSSLAAQAAADSRRAGKADPLESVAEITPALLVELGVNEAAQGAAVVGRYIWSIRTMCDIGEYAAGLKVLKELLCSCEWKHANNRAIADIRLLAARAYWRQKSFGSSLLSASRAVITRPIVFARPLRALGRRLRPFDNGHP